MRDGDGTNEFDLDAGAHADADDGSNEFNLDADCELDAGVNNDMGANVNDDADADDEDTALCANDACKFVSTVIGDTTSCCPVITDDAVKDNVANADTVAAAVASAAAAAFTLSLVHALAFRPRCCPIADAVFLPLIEFII